MLARFDKQDIIANRGYATRSQPVDQLGMDRTRPRPVAKACEAFFVNLHDQDARISWRGGQRQFVVKHPGAKLLPCRRSCGCHRR